MYLTVRTMFSMSPASLTLVDRKTATLQLPSTKSKMEIAKPSSFFVGRLFFMIILNTAVFVLFFAYLSQKFIVQMSSCSKWIPSWPEARRKKKLRLLERILCGFLHMKMKHYLRGRKKRWFFYENRSWMPRSLKIQVKYNSNNARQKSTEMMGWELGIKQTVGCGWLY